MAEPFRHSPTGWYCCACGGPATYGSPSLDPAHPFGRCRELVGPYHTAAHGGHPVPVTRSLQDAAGILAQRQREQLRERHAKHLLSRLVASCPYCTELQDAMFRTPRHEPA